MRLFELFDQTYTYKLDSYTANDLPYPNWNAEFTAANGLRYDVSIGQDAWGDPEEVQVDFRILNLPWDRKGQWELSGTGDSYRVMGTVFQIIRRYASEIAPTRIAFTADADEPSRVRLYRRMFRDGSVPGYTVATNDLSGSVEFILTRSS